MSNKCCDDVSDKSRYGHDGSATTATMGEAGKTFANGASLKVAVEKAIEKRNSEDICRLIETCVQVLKGLSGRPKTIVGSWKKKLSKACENSGGVRGNGPTVIKGCTDQNYEEYDPTATALRQSDCQTLKIVKVYGCTDSAAWNYNSKATDDNGKCEFAEEVKLLYSYSFCNIKAGCDMVESPTKLIFNAGINEYINETQLSDTDDNVLFFAEKIVGELSNNLKTSGGFFPWGSDGWYRTTVDTTIKKDLAKALTLAIMSTFEFEFFPYKKVTVYDGDNPIGEFIIIPGTDNSVPSKRIQSLTPSNSKNIVIARSKHNTPLKKTVNIGGLNKALTDRGITQYRVVQNGNSQVLVNVEITEPNRDEVSQNDVVDDGGGMNLTPELVIGLANILKEEPIGLSKILK